MKPLQNPDRMHLDAAVGWLELGNLVEASNELENITPRLRAHPDVLQVRCKIYVAAQKWDYVAEVANMLCTMLPDSSFGPLHLAHALRELNQPLQAKIALLGVADKFPEEWRIPFLLSCYCCRLNEHKDALRWVEQAIDVAGKVDIRLKALEEPDLEPLWIHIGEI